MQYPSELCRNNLHPAQDKNSSGQCRLCSLATDRTYKAKQRAALELVRALEARGVHVDIESLALSENPTASAQQAADRIVSEFGDIE
ncbi:hypothetical protein WSS_A15209 [Rhodococcus opacus M213]|uniref:Uncharacterized protein n=1 Tax=Rhodococcus opacus M213 TaxID=1129896 RepID=K8XUJ8_RHOOP|nr:hypothetical protein [Rhodococcus opacus]EKT81852.1 hypothetical protein WSS_A15209 [Rhodococcus opacus M213]